MNTDFEPQADQVLLRQRLVTTAIVIAKFAAVSLCTLLILSALTFLATNFRSPEEQAMANLGNEATKEQLQAFVQMHGLDEPVAIRYAKWVGRAAIGDFGYSNVTREPVVVQLLPRLINTMVLALLSLIVAAVVAIPIGIAMARRAYSALDRSVLTGSVIVASLPEFIVGVLLIYVLSVKLGLTPVDSSSVSLNGLLRSPGALVLPILTFVGAIVPYLVRICRAGMIDALSSASVRSATLRGLSPRIVTYKYSIRLVALPLIGALSISTTSLLGGSLVVENIFGYPGLGQLAVAALTSNDLPTLQACTLALGAMIVVTNFVADLFSVKFNPRLRASHV